MEYQFWGLDPLGYHVDNVLLHTINAIILWRVLIFLGIPAAWLVSAIFALHPVHVESVAWITERKNVLSGFFYLLSLFTFFRFYFPGQLVFPSENPIKNRSSVLYGVSLFFFVCALLSKTVTCTLPAVIFLLFWWKQNHIHLKIVQLMAPFFVIGLGFATLTRWLEKVNVGALGSEWDFSFWDRFLIAGQALWFYIGKLIWPFPIIFTYPRWNIDDSVWWQYLYPATFLLLILILWALRNKIGRGPLTAILFFSGFRLLQHLPHAVLLCSGPFSRPRFYRDPAGHCWWNNPVNKERGIGLIHFAFTISRVFDLGTGSRLQKCVYPVE